MRIFQDYKLIPYLDVRENIMLAFEATHKNLGQTKIKETSRTENNTIDNLLEEVHLAGYANHLAGQLSGGEQQRVAIARALCCDAETVILDEPTKGLSESDAAELLELLRRIARSRDPKRVVIIVTSDDAVASAAQKVYDLTD